jgi:hypothetical protein
MKNTFFLAILLATILLLACRKEPLEADPAKIILGKWEIIEYGTGDNLMIVDPDGFHYFKNDSVLLFYSYAENQYTAKSKYWFSDSLLYWSTFWEIEDYPDGGITVTRRYEYLFYEKNNKLRLISIDITTINTIILKRKN